MSEQQAVRAGTHATVTVLRMGTLLGAALLLGGVLLDAVRGGGGGPAIDPTTIPAGLVALKPGAWVSAGALVLLLTPPAGLVATALEFLHLEPRYTGVCLLVLGVLATSVAIAVRI